MFFYLFKSYVKCICTNVNLFSFVVIIRLTRSCRNLIIDRLGIDCSSSGRNWTCWLSVIVRPVKIRGFQAVMSLCQAGAQLAMTLITKVIPRWCNLQYHHSVRSDGHVRWTEAGKEEKIKKYGKDTSTLEEHCKWWDFVMHEIIHRGCQILNRANEVSYTCCRATCVHGGCHRDSKQKDDVKVASFFRWMWWRCLTTQSECSGCRCQRLHAYYEWRDKLR